MRATVQWWSPVRRTVTRRGRSVARSNPVAMSASMAAATAASMVVVSVVVVAGRKGYGGR